ncbi:MAG: hypothetical protein JXB14_03485 [Candidatus Altiarchaeota archaeon]|nr:hypothetical protein [Candidatus Altiarchaeota archaeon]
MEKFWKRHANPWSGATRMATYPFLLLAIWHHNWYALGIIIIWVVINPLVFPKPKRMDSWLSKGVLGEEMWTAKWRWDLSLFLNFLIAVFFLLALYTTYMNLFWPALYSATLPFILKLWFFDRMVVYYERKGK